MMSRLAIRTTSAQYVFYVWLACSCLSVTSGGSLDVVKEVVWDPLAHPVWQADTLFLPDLSSPEAIEASGGFLHGHHNEGLRELRPLFEFGGGRFGPAVRVKAANVQHYWVWFPLDGLIGADEFTLEFQAKSDRPWKHEHGGIFFRVNSRENQIAFRIEESGIRVEVSSPFSKGSRQIDLGLKAGRWHAFAATLHNQKLRLYVDGRERGQIEDVRFEPVWSDGAGGTEGIQLGGSPWRSTNLWISDVRISRTARVPNKPVKLLTLQSTLVVDAATTLDSVPPQIGALHPGQKQWPPSKYPGATPQHIRNALQVVRTDKFLQATPIKEGPPDKTHPSLGHTGHFSYDWQVVDRTLDWFRSHGVKPYISIDAAPSILGGTVEPFAGEKLRTAMSRSAGFHPEMPNDLNAWAVIVEDFVHHVLCEHKTKVPWWGVWNEPDQPGFWSGTVEDYLKLYEATVLAVKRVDRNAKVGGPESSGLHEPWVEALIKYCGRKDLPLDFVSYHDYSGDLNTPELVRAKVDRLTTGANLKTPMPIVIGEFNWSAGNLYKPDWPRFHRDFWHIKAFGAAYTTAFLARMVDLPALELMVWSHTHYGDPHAGGWAAAQLIGPNREQWAPYNALKGWRAVTGDRVLHTERNLSPGVFAAATTNSETYSIGIVLANYGYAQRQTRSITITLNNLPPGVWLLQQWCVDPVHSSRLDVGKDKFGDAKYDDLEKIDERDLHAAGDQPLVIQLDLPAWNSTFVRLHIETALLAVGDDACAAVEYRESLGPDGRVEARSRNATPSLDDANFDGSTTALKRAFSSSLDG